jgi:hypothetical protein
VWHALYRDNTWSKAAFRGGDLATLVLTVPVLVVALAMARRGNSGARLVWLGVLVFNVYNYAFYVFGTTFNKLFLLYAALLGASILTLVFATPTPSTCASSATVPGSGWSAATCSLSA